MTSLLKRCAMSKQTFYLQGQVFVFKAYLKDNNKINLVFLPSYSPELNLIERLWRFFKKNVLYNQYYSDVKAFREACVIFFRNIGQHKEKLKVLLGGGFQGFY